jgi:thiamine-monophosphate kinase
MAGVPRHAIVSLCLPPDYEVSWLDGFYDGFLERAAETGVSVVGGNLSAIAGPAVVSVTALGQASHPVTRAGGKAGDLLVVTGTLGAAAAGLKLLGQGARLDDDGELKATGVWTTSSALALVYCLRAQLDPEPPLRLARALAETGLLHAAIDLSDGLSADLARICEESGLCAVVDAFAVPVSPHVTSLERARGGDALAMALHGGEDYQLLLVLPPESLRPLQDLAVIWDLALATIGELVEGEPQILLKAGTDLLPLAAAAHEHFRPTGGDAT